MSYMHPYNINHPHATSDVIQYCERKQLALALKEPAGSCQCDRVIQDRFADSEIAIDPIVYVFVFRNRISLETRPIAVSRRGLVF